MMQHAASMLGGLDRRYWTAEDHGRALACVPDIMSRIKITDKASVSQQGFHCSITLCNLCQSRTFPFMRACGLQVEDDPTR